MTVFKFVEHPENNEKHKLNKKSKAKFKIMSLKVKPGVEFVPELVCPSFLTLFIRLCSVVVGIRCVVARHIYHFFR